ncbi:MAG: phosphatase PAP2 family protein [Alcaligenaceae bacterium]|nr:MAG: phosphatase PAP2 family protein [Alcaligenaceae bacterium]
MAEWGDLLARYGALWTAAMVVAACLIGYGIGVWVRPPGAGSGPSTQLSGRARVLLVAWAVIGLGVFTAMVHALRDPGGALDLLDTHLAQGLAATLPPAFLQGVAVFTQIGDRAFLMGVGASVLAILLWYGRWSLALAWVAASAGGGALNKILKAMFERVRPEHAHGFLQAEGFSFPSGHATGAVAVYGMLAFVLARTVTAHRHPILFSAACGLIAAVGLSRVLLHVHYISDVLAGWAVTSAWIAACILIFDAVVRVRKG